MAAEFAGGAADALERVAALDEGLPALAQLGVDLRRDGAVPLLEIAGGGGEDRAQAAPDRAPELLELARVDQPQRVGQPEVAADVALDLGQAGERVRGRRRLGQAQREAELGVDLGEAGLQHRAGFLVAPRGELDALA